MNELFLFLLKSIIVSGILCIWYMLFLKNRRLHNYNRFFLLFSLYASIQVPLLHFKWSPEYEKPLAVFTPAKMLLQTLNNTHDIQQNATNTPVNDVDWKIIIILITVLISVGMITKMLIRIACVLRIGKQYPNTVTDGITIVHTDLHNAPFSFMNKIFWRDSISPLTVNGRLILRHELAHVKQKHTYDKLFCQLLTCIFWMNPFYWLIQKELNMVHEFIADEQSIINNSDGILEMEYTDAFAKMLLQVHNHTNYFSPEHHFFSSPIKRRLTMLQLNKKVRASLIRRLGLLPLMAGTILIFAFSPQIVNKSIIIKADKKIVLVVDAGHGGDDEGCYSGLLFEKNLNLKVAEHIKMFAPNYNIEVHLTRENDKFMSLEERVDFSNKLHPDDFISIHVNDQQGKETGKGTFDIAINDKTAMIKESKRLAFAIFKHASRPEWEQKNAFSEKNLFVLRNNTSAAVLIEIGDIKNKEQMQHIEDDVKLDELCNRILEGVVDAHKK